MIYLVIFCQYDFFYNPSPVCLPVLRGQCFIGLLEISVEDFPECFWIHPGWLEFNNGGVGKLFFQTGIFLFIIFVRDPAFLEEDIKAFQLFFDSFRIFTLSFGEYLMFKEKYVDVGNLKAELASYVRLGGFPATHLQAYSQDEIYTIVRDIYNSTIFSDIVKRNQVRKIDQLERVVKYTFNNVGNTFSAKSIADYLKSERRSLDNETVYSYLEKLEKAYLLHRCSRYDLQGKEILKTQEKFYLADVSLRYSVLGYNADSVASSLENIVYLELCRRGYTVNVGKTGDGEIDFVATRQNEKVYVQVTQEIKSEKTEKREYDRLLEIHDNYPKYVLTTDEFAGGNYEGIKTMHIADFLLNSEY